MSKQVMSNATILAGEELEITRGYLVIEDGMVSEISGGSTQRRSTNLNGAFVISPFVNAHTHVADAVAKELYLGKAQPQVVGPGGEKFKALNSSPPRAMEEATKATLQDMVSTGTLAHCDFREGGVQGVNFLKRVSPSKVVSRILGRFSKISELSNVLAKADGLGLPRVDAFPQDEMRLASGRALKAKKLFGVHVAETADEKAAFFRKFGKSEVDQSIDINCSFVVHATHSSEEDLSRLKKSKIPVVFCPRANSLLGVGVPPIGLALKTGADFFFGTDNAMVCQPNMFEEISFAWKCLRRADTSSGSEEARKMLAAATIGPLGLFNLPWGPITEGQSATFMVISRGNNLLHLSDVYSGLVNRARADNIRAIYLDGKIIISGNTKNNLYKAKACVV
ncbi:MAG: amidohydrolase family protein [Methanobacteriota archaeon]